MTKSSFFSSTFSSFLISQGVVLQAGDSVDVINGSTALQGNITVTGEANINNQGQINLSGNLTGVTFNGAALFIFIIFFILLIV